LVTRDEEALESIAREPYFSDDSVTLWHGDCLDVMATLPDDSVDAIVTDPPYGLGFMGQKWDTYASESGRAPSARAKFDHVGGNHNPSNSADASRTRRVESQRFGEWCEAWCREALRVLKPGGHLLAFGGTRTWHRLAVAVEDAGFEVRDSIFWIYGSGFPKSLNVSKDARFCKCDAVDSSHGSTQRVDPLERCGADDSVRPVRDTSETPTEPGEAQRADLLLAELSQPSARRSSAGERLRRDGEAGTVSLGSREPGVEGRGDAQAPARQLHGRPVRPLPAGVRVDGPIGRLRDGAPDCDGAVDRPPADPLGVREPHQPPTVGQPAGEPGSLADERGSQAWRGWPLCAGCGKPSVPAGLGTALKPSAEPVVVARKPLVGTVAANVLAHGTGALNIDGCRVPGVPPSVPQPKFSRDMAAGFGASEGRNGAMSAAPAGRWPTNVVLDGDQADELDRQSGKRKAGGSLAGSEPSRPFKDAYGVMNGRRVWESYGDEGGASRFFPVFRAPCSQAPIGVVTSCEAMDCDRQGCAVELSQSPAFRYEAKASSSERPSYVMPGADGQVDNTPPRTGRRCNVCGNQTVGAGGRVWPACGHDDWSTFETANHAAGRVAHPTVKPLDLMRWLVRLVTPPGGTVLEPFAGSGTTAEACVIEGFRCIAIEREAAYLPLIVARLSKPIQPDLFGGAA
jgi:DNA modification methylase